jgi:Tfp pilus assembly PilM family ATPase
MSSNVTDIGKRTSAIAIVQDGSRLKAVELSRKRGIFEVLWTKSSEAGDLDWKAFELECGLAGEQTKKADATVVAGFNSTGVVFYRIEVPSGRKEEIAAMVRMQAESRLPLSADQMELAWRVDQSRNGKAPVTIAAARREQLERFVVNVQGFEPAKILLDCEGIVKAWREIFSGNQQDAVVVSISARNTQVCLAQNGRLSNAVVLDMGTDDFVETSRDMAVSVGAGFTDQTETTERFIQDIRSVLELFGCAEPAGLPLFVLSDVSAEQEVIVSCLKSAGLNVSAAYPQTEKLDGRTRLGPEDIYEYRVPIGLALTALDGETDGLNIFEDLYVPAGEAKRKRRLYSPKVAYVIAAVMLLLLVIISYAVDVARPGAIEKRLSITNAGTDIEHIIERQKLIKSVAEQRIDLLALLNLINKVDAPGIKLNKLDFKKGRTISLSGQTKDNDQLYKFQKSLMGIKGITEVNISNATPNSKTKKVDFTVTFHYKDFTKTKRARR